MMASSAAVKEISGLVVLQDVMLAVANMDRIANIIYLFMVLIFLQKYQILENSYEF